jgi:hypothetical protein
MDKLKISKKYFSSLTAVDSDLLKMMYDDYSHLFVVVLMAYLSKSLCTNKISTV